MAEPDNKKRGARRLMFAEEPVVVINDHLELEEDATLGSDAPPSSRSSSTDTAGLPFRTGLPGSLNLAGRMYSESPREPREAARDLSAVETPPPAIVDQSPEPLWTRVATTLGHWQQACSCSRPPEVHIEETEEHDIQFDGPPADPPPPRASGVEIVEVTVEAFTVLTIHDGNEDEEGMECPVCFDGFLVGEELRILPCMHRYHRECIDRWLFKRPVCAKCKQSVFSMSA